MPSSIPGIILAVVIFVVLFVTILDALRRGPGFSRGVSGVLAACASLLAVIGMFHFLGPRPPSRPEVAQASDWEALLLPYAAMGISMLLVLLLLFLKKVGERIGMTDSTQRSDSAVLKRRRKADGVHDDRSQPRGSKLRDHQERDIRRL